MADRASERLVDLSHVIEDGMTTHKGLPGPHICDFWTREASARNYDDGATFQIGRIEMVANTGTYVDSPFHRYAEGKDLSELPLESLADLEGLVVRRPFEEGTAVDADAFAGLDLRGKAVLVHTGWSRHWRTEAYLSGHPFLTLPDRGCGAGAGRRRRRFCRNRQSQYRRYRPI
jgi:arylformamidase